MSPFAKSRSAEQARRKTTKGATLASARLPGRVGPYAGVMALHHGAGNRAVSRLVQPGGDRPPSPRGVPPVVQSVLRGGGGQPLDPTTRASMEAHFGEDFSQVLVHMDVQAAESARAGRAVAYTVGRDVVFGPGRYAPGTPAGQRLLAHELAHVVQQRQAGTVDADRVSQPGDSFERAADRAAAVTSAGQPAPLAASGAPPAIQYQEDELKSPLTIPAEGIDMPWVGKGPGVASSELGYLRDSNYFWREYAKLWPEQLSKENMDRVGTSRPIVDDTWIKYHPEHAAYKGQPLEHHHLGQGSRAVPLPEKLHDAYTVFHPQRQVVGKGSGPLKPLAPLPTQRQEREIQRHIKEGRIPDVGIDPTRPPWGVNVPLSSALAGVPQSQLWPVPPDITVDPATGMVRRLRIDPSIAPGPRIDPSITPGPRFDPRPVQEQRLRIAPQDDPEALAMAEDEAALLESATRGVKINELHMGGGPAPGGASGGLVVTAIGLLAGPFLPETEKQKADRQKLQSLEPQLKAKLAALQEEIAAAAAKSLGKTVWANVTITIKRKEPGFNEAMEAGPLAPAGPGPIEEVALNGVAISLNRVEETEGRGAYSSQVTYSVWVAGEDPAAARKALVRQILGATTPQHIAQVLAPRKGPSITSSGQRVPVPTVQDPYSESGSYGAWGPHFKRLYRMRELQQKIDDIEQTVRSPGSYDALALQKERDELSEELRALQRE
jgi:hypothetical protein